jgi:leucyl-tRNA synthetase
VDLAPLDRTVARVGRDLERLKFNTAIASLMSLARWAERQRRRMSVEEWSRTAATITLLLAPLAPHLAEELWARLGCEYSVHQRTWPAPDGRALVESEVTLVVQVDGRLRARLVIPVGLSQAETMRRALAVDSVERQLHGERPRKVFHVPDRLINLVT